MLQGKKPPSVQFEEQTAANTGRGFMWEQVMMTVFQT
jgi:hypothetical protein